jgi:hypothetical protein
VTEGLASSQRLKRCSRLCSSLSTSKMDKLTSTRSKLLTNRMLILKSPIWTMVCSMSCFRLSRELTACKNWSILSTRCNSRRRNSTGKMTIPTSGRPWQKPRQVRVKWSN